MKTPCEEEGLRRLQRSMDDIGQGIPDRPVVNPKESLLCGGTVFVIMNAHQRIRSGLTFPMNQRNGRR